MKPGTPIILRSCPEHPITRPWVYEDCAGVYVRSFGRGHAQVRLDGRTVRCGECGGDKPELVSLRDCCVHEAARLDLGGVV